MIELSKEHTVVAMSERRRVDGKAQVRYRGRCSCGRETHMHYSTPEAARVALRRTHLRDIGVVE